MRSLILALAAVVLSACGQATQSASAIPTAFGGQYISKEQGTLGANPVYLNGMTLIQTGTQISGRVQGFYNVNATTGVGQSVSGDITGTVLAATSTATSSFTANLTLYASNGTTVVCQGTITGSLTIGNYVQAGVTTALYSLNGTLNGAMGSCGTLSATITDMIRQ